MSNEYAHQGRLQNFSKGGEMFWVQKIQEKGPKNAENRNKNIPYPPPPTPWQIWPHSLYVSCKKGWGAKFV